MCLQDPQVNLYQKSKGGAKWISQDWPLVRAPALRRRRLPAGTPPPRVANSSLPAASSHPCHMTRSPSLLPPSPPPSKAPPALRPPSYLIDAATNATSSILCRCRGEAPSPRSPPALLTASERRRGRVLVCPRFPKMSRTSSEAKGASCGTIKLYWVRDGGRRTPVSNVCALCLSVSCFGYGKSFCTGFQC